MADGLEKMVQWYEDSVEATIESRRLSERDRDYYDNKQWTQEEAGKLEKRGQAPIVINRIKPKVDFLLGQERQLRTDPRAAPRTPMDEEASHAATDAIRYVCDEQDFSKTRSDVFENITVEGSGGAIVEVVQGRKRPTIVIRRIPWDRMFVDPHSRERDYSDAKYKGIVAWMDVEDAIALYGEDKRELLETQLSSDDGDTYDDKPNYWVDRNRSRVKVCEVYYKQGGTWMYCVYTQAGFMREPAPSSYQDEDGRPDCPIEYESCHVDRQNRRYGLVRQLIGPQDEINKRRSKALHLLSTRQVRAERGAVDDVRLAKKEMNKPDGWIETNPGYQFEVLQTADMAMGNFNLLQEAKQEIDAVGANAALTGKDEKALSGRALQARQQGGLVELGPVFDSLRQWQRRIYKQIWNRIRQFWTAEVWVRVTDDENNVKFVGLNSFDPMQGMVNNVAEMDMDIIMEDVPDTINIQAEQFQTLADMYQANPQGIPFDLVIEASTLRNKKAILERIRPDPEAQAQEQAQKQQIEQAAMQTKLRGENAKAAKDEAQATNYAAQAEKTQVDTVKAMVEPMVQPQIMNPTGF